MAKLSLQRLLENLPPYISVKNPDTNAQLEIRKIDTNFSQWFAHYKGDDGNDYYDTYGRTLIDTLQDLYNKLKKDEII